MIMHEAQCMSYEHQGAHHDYAEVPNVNIAHRKSSLPPVLCQQFPSAWIKPLQMKAEEAMNSWMTCWRHADHGMLRL